jgi:predicted pyridoxine 5'-phosphate oxidase superfamily flavin-nucleotide-binding protein
VPFDATSHPPIRRQPTTAPRPGLRGSQGEHLLQCAYGTEERAARFYADQVRDRLLPAMTEFVGRMEMVFVATSDGRGDCDASLRAGPPGFIQVLDERHLAYPEYRGNGVHASLGNITENPHIGMLMVDFERDLIGLHVNGRARIVEDAELRAWYPMLPLDSTPGRRAERWVVIEVDEAYIHCRKHIPRMARIHQRRSWGTDDPGRKGGDYFGARAQRRAQQRGLAVPGAVNRSVPEVRDDGSALAKTVPVPAVRTRSSFPSTTHLPAGSATARPLRTGSRSATQPLASGPARRRIRWLSS